MYLTATSTSILLLQNDISYLMNSFDWIVGGIGVVTTIVILLVGWFQANKTKNLTKQEVERLKNELDKIQERTLEKINNEIKLGTDKVYEQLKNELSVVVDEIKLQINSNKDELKKDLEDSKAQMEKIKNEANGEIARHFAYSTTENKNHAIALNWALYAASSFMLSDTNHELINNCLKTALTNLKAIEKNAQSEIDFLIERSDQNEKYLKILEISKAETVKILREELKKKIIS